MHRPHPPQHRCTATGRGGPAGALGGRPLSYPAPKLESVNRTDRLYALVEEMRAVAPRPRSARWLAGRFEVSVRTVERDITALQQSGVPIYAELGRTGGYCLDKARTLPPVNLTPGEAVAMAVALRGLEGSPFRGPAGSALRKLVAAMQVDDAAAARDLAGCIHLLGDAGTATSTPSVPHLVADALSTRRVLRIGYDDRGTPCAPSAPTGSPRSRSPPRCPRHACCAARISTSPTGSSISSPSADSRAGAAGPAPPRTDPAARRLRAGRMAG